MNRFGEYSFECDLSTSLLGELHEFRDQRRFIVERIFLRKPSLRGLHARHYLSSVESHIAEEFISKQNYEEMKTLASSFTGCITSFFGFETRLNNPDASSDYLFAVSSQGKERETLANQFLTGKLPQSFYSTNEWKNIGKFVTTWADPSSALYNKVLGLWFEFDMVDHSEKVPIPCVFLHTIPIQPNNSDSIQSCNWLTSFALPLLTGQKLPEVVEQRVQDAIRKLPEGVSVFQVGVMLSRATSGIRLVLNKIQPGQIIPYLKTLGWSDKNEQLSNFIDELTRQGTHIILHITIGEKGVDPKIGLECSFYPFRYNFETRWSVFLDYLVQKGWCLSEKKDALLRFPGVNQEDMTTSFNLDSYVKITSSSDTGSSGVLVRYISHVKLVFLPTQPPEAKVYSGVRLFGSSREPDIVPSEGIY